MPGRIVAQPAPPPYTASPTGNTIYRIGRFDRVLVGKHEYRHVCTTAVGHLLQRSDIEPAIAQTFEHRNFNPDVDRGHIVIEPDFFSPHKAVDRVYNLDNFIANLEGKKLRIFHWRRTWCEVLHEARRKTSVVLVDASIEEHLPVLKFEVDRRWKEADRMGTQQNCDREITTPGTPCAKTIRTWYAAWLERGLAGIVPGWAKRGNREQRLSIEEISLMSRCVLAYADPLRPTPEQVANDTKETFELRNLEREAEGLPPLNIPSSTTIKKAIRSLDPFYVDLHRFDLAYAIRNAKPQGIGLVVERPLERVEIDEWKIDAITLFAYLGIDEMLCPKTRKALSGRWYLSTAIDCATRCILAMRLTRAASSRSSIETLEMILADKGQYADAVGALTPWHMRGRPIGINNDAGGGCNSHAFIAAANTIGINTMRPATGKPWLRAYIERVFKTCSVMLTARLGGRTFANIMERGDYPSHELGALNPDELAFVLIRWVVDIYHNIPRGELSGETPYQAWTRLVTEHGTPPPPSPGQRRLAFGITLKRKLRDIGVEVMGARYSSREIEEWRVHNRNKTVDVRWLPSDIGAVEVKLGPGHWVVAHSVHIDLTGVHAREWRAALADVRERMRATRKTNVETIHKAMLAIKEVNAKAMARAGLLVEDWSPEEIEREESQLFIGFQVTYPDKGEPGPGERPDPLAGGFKIGEGLPINPARLVDDSTVKLEDESDGFIAASTTGSDDDNSDGDDDTEFTFIDRDKDA